MVLTAQRKLCALDESSSGGVVATQAAAVQGCTHLLLQLQGLQEGGVRHINVQRMDITDMDQVVSYLTSLLESINGPDCKRPTLHAFPSPLALAAVDQPVSLNSLDQTGPRERTLTVLFSRPAAAAAGAPHLYSQQEPGWAPVRVVLTQQGRQLLNNVAMPEVLGADQARLLLDISNLQITSPGAVVVAVLTVQRDGDGAGGSAGVSSMTGLPAGAPVALLTVPVMSAAACWELQRHAEQVIAAYAQEDPTFENSEGSADVSLTCAAYVRDCHDLCTDLGHCLSEAGEADVEVGARVLQYLLDNKLEECTAQVVRVMAGAGQLADAPPDAPSATGSNVLVWLQQSATGREGVAEVASMALDAASTCNRNTDMTPRQPGWQCKGAQANSRSGDHAAGSSKEVNPKAAADSMLPATPAKVLPLSLSRQLAATSPLRAALLGYPSAELERRYLEFKAVRAWPLDCFLPWCIALMNAGRLVGTAPDRLFTCGLLALALMPVAIRMCLGRGNYMRARGMVAAAYYLLGAVWTLASWWFLPGLSDSYITGKHRIMWVLWGVVQPFLWRVRAFATLLETGSVLVPLALMFKRSWQTYLQAVVELVPIVPIAAATSALLDWRMRRQFAAAAAAAAADKMAVD